MLEVSDDFDRLMLLSRSCGGEAAEDSSVQNAHEHVVDARVGAKEDKEAVVHDSEAHVHSREAFVCHLILKEYHLPVVQDRIVFS